MIDRPKRRKKPIKSFFQRFSNSWFSEATGLTSSIKILIENFAKKISFFFIIFFRVVEKSLHSFCAIFAVPLVLFVYKCNWNQVQYSKEVVIRCLDHSKWGGMSKSVWEPQGRDNKLLFQKKLSAALSSPFWIFNLVFSLRKCLSYSQQNRVLIRS